MLMRPQTESLPLMASSNEAIVVISTMRITSHQNQSKETDDNQRNYLLHSEAVVVVVVTWSFPFLLKQMLKLD